MKVIRGALKAGEKPYFDAVIITRYPISDDDLSPFAGLSIREVKIIVVSAIVKVGTRSLLQQLRHISCKSLYVFLHSETDRPLLPALIFLGSQVSLQSQFMVIGNSQPVKLSALALPSSLVKLSWATLGCGVRSFFAIFRCSQLMKKPRVLIDDRNGLDNHFAMIKLTLWFGMQTGGAFTHFLGIARAAQRAGNKVTAISTESVPFNSDDEYSSHAPIIPPTTYITPRELNHFGAHFYFLNRAKEELKDFRGVIYQRVSAGNFLGVELSRRFHLPLIAEFNGSEIWLSRNWGTPYVFLKAVEKTEQLMLQHAHMVVVVSQPLKQQLIDRGIDADRIVIVKNGFDATKSLDDQRRIESRARLRNQLGIDHNAVVFCFVGTFGPWHGVHDLAKSVARFYSIYGDTELASKARFILIGDGVGRDAVEAIVHKEIDAKQIILTGAVKPELINEYLAASDVCLLPTISNKDGTEFFGSPTKLFEYMGAGKAVIATEVGQAKEILQGAVPVDRFDELADSENQDQCGILVPSGSVRKLIDAYKHILNAPKWRETAGQNAQKRAYENFTWDHSFKAINDNLIGIRKSQKEPPTIKLLINAIHSKSGGGVTYLRNILPLLCADPRLNVHVCLSKKQLPMFEAWIGDATLKIVEINDSLWKVLFFEQFSMPRLAQKIQADVTFSPANYGPLLARRTVVLLRNALSVAFVERRLLKMLYWLLLYFGTLSSALTARRVIGVSEYAKRSTIGRFFDWPKGKYQTIPHGISREFEVDNTVERDRMTLLLVSDIYVQKNLHTFFEALPRLRDQYPELKIQIAGASVDLGYKIRLEERLLDLNLTDNVEFMGNLDIQTLKTLYQRAALFVFPSTVETFGNPLVEAMACGAPVASSNTAAMPEVAGDAAEYFNPHDADDIARVIGQLLDDNERREELSRLGIERAKMYSWDETARKTADVLIEAARN